MSKVLSGMASAAVALLASTGVVQAQVVLNLAHTYRAESPEGRATTAAAEHFAACTDGTAEIRIFTDGQQGDESALNEQIKFGAVDLIETGLLFASAQYPRLGINALPYLFRDKEHAVAYQSSEVAQRLIEEWNEATGLRMLSFGYHGAFNISSNTAIESVADVKDLKIRTPPTPLFQAFPRSIGANPTPIPFGDVYMSLQQGVADGSLDNLSVTYDNKLYEVQDYVAVTEHLMEFIALVASPMAIAKLDEAQQACLHEAARVFADVEAKGNMEYEDQLPELMEAEGMISFTYPDKDEFRAASQSGAEELINSQPGWSRELVDEIQAIR